MNSIEAYKLNFQTIYHNPSSAKICAINLIEIGKDYFRSTYKFNNIEKLEAASSYLKKGQDPPRDLYINFAFNHLIDTIKIGICFENYFKAHLLINLFLVHKLDHNIFKVLFQEQKKRPISIEELLDTAKWEPYLKTNPKFPEIETFWIKGILEETVSYSTLLNNIDYYDLYSIDTSILNQLKLINADRNKLHLNVSNSMLLLPDSYTNFKMIVDFIEDKIPNLVNSLFDELNIPQEHRTFQEVTERVPII